MSGEERGLHRDADEVFNHARKERVHVLGALGSETRSHLFDPPSFSCAAWRAWCRAK